MKPLFQEFSNIIYAIYDYMQDDPKLQHKYIAVLAEMMTNLRDRMEKENEE
jgi:hypothetical protein